MHETERSNPVFWENEKNKITICRLLKLLPRVRSFNKLHIQTRSQKGIHRGTCIFSMKTSPYKPYHAFSILYTLKPQKGFVFLYGHKIILAGAFKVDDVFSGQGPVVQSVVSLTSSLRVISLTVLADSIHNILIFFAEKM